MKLLLLCEQVQDCGIRDALHADPIYDRNKRQPFKISKLLTTIISKTDT